MLLQKSIIGNSRAGQAQWAEVQTSRQMANNQERFHAMVMQSNGSVAVNEGMVPRDVYQEFDTVAVERFRSDDGDSFLNDLLPLSRSVTVSYTHLTLPTN